jgi:hypothetical protein
MCDDMMFSLEQQKSNIVILVFQADVCVWEKDTEREKRNRDRDERVEEIEKRTKRSIATVEQKSNSTSNSTSSSTRSFTTRE